MEPAGPISDHTSAAKQDQRDSTGVSGVSQPAEEPDVSSPWIALELHGVIGVKCVVVVVVFIHCTQTSLTLHDPELFLHLTAVMREEPWWVRNREQFSMSATLAF